jgi:diadenosine tetraphosphate (Ap4A) HIT family hydrolase
MSKLDSRLAEDTYHVGYLPLCRVLLMNDSHYPWLILVPERENITEIYQLDEADQVQLIHESSAVARMLMDGFKGDKMNIGALGNMVPQLHIHHIVRKQTDPAWPGPVWGAHPAQAYSPATAEERLALIRGALGKQLPFDTEVPPT